MYLKTWSNATPGIKIAALLLICHFSSFFPCAGQRVLAYAAPSPGRHSSPSYKMTVYPDSVIYLFNTNVLPRADKEYIRPLLFRIKLPPGILSTYKSGFSSFGFQYSEKQAVYVHLDNYSTNAKDTSYTIKDGLQIERLLMDDLNAVNAPDKLNIDNNPFNAERSCWVIKKGKATILLYNILKKDSARFLNYTAGSFTFL